MTTPVSKELVTTEQLQGGIMVAAYEALHGPVQDPMQLEGALALFAAEVTIAEETPKSELTASQRSLVHVAKVTKAMGSAIGNGLITTPEDVDGLTDALVLTPGLDPSAALKYLKNRGFSKLERTVTPRELINALSLRPDFEESRPNPDEDGEPIDTTPSIGRLIRAANLAGISLAGIEITDDLSISLIAAKLASLPMRVQRSIVADDPKDGPVGRHFSIRVRADSSMHPSAAAVNPSYSGEFPENPVSYAQEWFEENSNDY